MTTEKMLRGVCKVVDACITGNHKKAVYFVDEKTTIKACRKFLGARLNPIDIVLTVGRPNYWERKYIKTARKAKQPFPFGPIFRDARPR